MVRPRLFNSDNIGQSRVDQGLPNSNAQMLQQQSSTIQQNLSAHWQQQPQFAIPPTQQMPALNMLAQQPQFSQLQWANQMPQTQQLQHAMLQMAPFNMPLISQQIVQEALAMSQPVIATDEPTLLTALLKAKKTDRNFKEAINGLHGVLSSHFHAQERVFTALSRPMATPQVCGRIIIWSTRNVSMTGLRCVSRKRRLDPLPPQILQQGTQGSGQVSLSKNRYQHHLNMSHHYL
jgi:hypothetical protein